MGSRPMTGRHANLSAKKGNKTPNLQEESHYLYGQGGGDLEYKKNMTIETIHKHLNSHHQMISSILDRLDIIEKRHLAFLEKEVLRLSNQSIGNRTENK